MDIFRAWGDEKTKPIQSQSKHVLSPFGYTQDKLRQMGQFQTRQVFIDRMMRIDYYGI